MNDINQTIAQIINMYDNKANPQQLMQNMLMQNPQLQQAQMQLQNMSKGRNPNEFLMQLAKQNGVNEQNMQGLARILGL